MSRSGSLGFRQSYGSTPSGTVSGGAVAQMVQVGIVDAHLTGGKADYSFFRSRIKIHNNFGIETIAESFLGNVNWGGEVSATLNKTPDLVTNIFAVIDRPGIYAVRGNSGSSGSSGSSGCRQNFKRSATRNVPPPLPRRFPTAAAPTKHIKNLNVQRSEVHPRHKKAAGRVVIEEEDEDEDETVPSELFWEENEEEGSEYESGEDADAPYAHWVNSLGHAAIARTSISLAGILGQMLTGRFISAWAELTGTCGKEQDSMIGAYGSLKELIEASKKDERLYVQLPFTFTRFTGRCLPLVSMRFHAASVSLALMPLNKLIKVSHPDVTVLKTSDGQPISKADVEAHLDVTAVFLDLEERKRFAKGEFQMLWEQLQMHEATYKGSTIRAPLNFSHPSRCLMFMIQRKELEDQNETFEYGCEEPDEDPVQFAKLIVNTTARFAREGAFFRKVVPFQHCPRTLKRNRYIYVMAFGLSIDGENTDGTLNFSRCDNCSLNLELHPSLSDDPVTLYVYDFSINVAGFKRGLSQILYQG